MSSDSRITVPVVFLIFKRDAMARRVFEAIRKARPRTLLVVADGPRADRPGEAAECEQTRRLIDTVDWDCDVRRCFAETNLGCGRRVATGLDWVFDQVEEAIILEEDVLPAPSFFTFCESLLARYRDDRRVVHIGGNNFQDGIERTPHSYFFSKYNHIWGWATWRRAWRLYDFDMADWPAVRGAAGCSAMGEDPVEREFWTGIFDDMHHHRIDTWDFAWTYACFRHGLSVYPRVNMVSHIGAGGDATHCTKVTSRDNLPVADIRDVSHPPTVECNREADDYTFSRVFGGERLRARKLAAAGGRPA